MVSAQVAGLLRIYAVDPKGAKHILHQGRTEYYGPGGSSEGAIATAVTPNLQVMMPLNPLVLSGGWRVVLSFLADAAWVSDVSDGVIQIPIRIEGYGSSQLNAVDLGNTVDFPASTPAVWCDLGTGKVVPDGERWKVGGGTCFMSVENAT